jgi:geranylgeranyl diphosphate synthase type II
MLIEALSSATGETKTQLEHWISLKTFDPAEKVNAVRGIYDQLGIRQLAEAKINEYFEKAFDLLDSLKVEAERKAELRAFANILIDREV